MKLDWEIISVIIITFFTVYIILTAQNAKAETIVDNCYTFTADNEIVVLNTSFVTSESSNCFYTTYNNNTINCNGYGILNNYSGSTEPRVLGGLSTDSIATIKNCSYLAGFQHIFLVSNGGINVSLENIYNITNNQQSGSGSPDDIFENVGGNAGKNYTLNISNVNIYQSYGGTAQSALYITDSAGFINLNLFNTTFDSDFYVYKKYNTAVSINFTYRKYWNINVTSYDNVSLAIIPNTELNYFDRIDFINKNITSDIFGNAKFFMPEFYQNVYASGSTTLSEDKTNSYNPITIIGSDIEYITNSTTFNITGNKNVDLYLEPIPSIIYPDSCDSCDSCNNIISSTNYTTINLNSSINADYNCIDIGSKTNLTFNCNDYDILGISSIDYTAIYIHSSSNITILNCNVSTFSSGYLLPINDNIFIINSNATNCDYGFNIYATSPLYIDSCDSSYNNIGFSLETSGVTINNSKISYNNYGWFPYYATGNYLINSYILFNNIYGIYLYEGNTYYNNILNNSVNYVPSGLENVWNNTEIGNFWSYPNGTGYSDLCNNSNLDYICDYPFNVSDSGIDYLPLTYLGTLPPEPPTPRNITYGNLTDICCEWDNPISSCIDDYNLLQKINETYCKNDICENFYKERIINCPYGCGEEIFYNGDGCLYPSWIIYLIIIILFVCFIFILNWVSK